MCTIICCLCFFFFSSRRRHTRCSRDWSSDVCSSDLTGHAEEGRLLLEASRIGDHQLRSGNQAQHLHIAQRLQQPQPATVAPRSEEHTSELQSRLHLVCRLLLEKKKTRPYSMNHVLRL